MATIAVYSLKGGVGKTSLAVNLAWCAATLSARRTLLWDLDPQAASTYLLGGARGKAVAQSVFSKDVEPARLIHPTAIERLDLIGADASLRGLDLLFHELDKKKRLAKLLAQLDGSYDRMLLDCPPGLTETSEQVMRAADLIVVPVIPSPLSERALEEVERHLSGPGSGKLRAALMPVHAMVDRRRRLHADALARNPDWPVIPMASMVEAMAVRRAPVGVFAPRSPATAAFAALWQAIELRLARRGRTAAG
ncbi:cellulose biosynthesis protein BcsQ [Sphingomonas sp. BE123]|uniref:ParA family protein n=1 Tax=unclassified Sphingomonas TaxID=196159 RepID=UPI0028569E5E|nr:ParA family protein [Sphingomonas sp. BE123]MDR6851488.1 cellulose biosynthesis protein BcsQ [Sphingomonas sp. BE123]